VGVACFQGIMHDPHPKRTRLKGPIDGDLGWGEEGMVPPKREMEGCSHDDYHQNDKKHLETRNKSIVPSRTMHTGRI